MARRLLNRKIGKRSEIKKLIKPAQRLQRRVVRKFGG